MQFGLWFLIKIFKDKNAHASVPSLSGCLKFPLSKRKRIIIFTADLPSKEGEDVHVRYVILEVLMDMH